MPRLQSLETTLKQPHLPDASSAFISFAKDKARWENEMNRLMSIKSLRGQAFTPLDPPPQTFAQAPVCPVTTPESSTYITPIQHITGRSAAQRIIPAPSVIVQTNPPPHSPISCPSTTPPYPESIPKNTHNNWVVNIPCPSAFSPCSPRETWPWPDWVCDAFVTGDVLWYTLGSEGKAHVNIRARRQDLLEYFERVKTNKGVVDMGDEKQRGAKEGLEKLEAENLCAKGGSQGNKMAETNSNKDIAQMGSEKQGLGKGVLEQPAAIQMEAEKLRVRMKAQWNESGEEGMEDWEVLGEEFADEGWVEVSNKRKIGEGWAKVRRTVWSGGEDEVEGA